MQEISMLFNPVKRWDFAVSSCTPDPCRLFNYDYPIAQRSYKSNDLRITDGYVRADNSSLRHKTYLLYINGKVEKEFNSVEAAKRYIR